MKILVTILSLLLIVFADTTDLIVALTGEKLCRNNQLYLLSYNKVLDKYEFIPVFTTEHHFKDAYNMIEITVPVRCYDIKNGKKVMTNTLKEIYDSK